MPNVPHLAAAAALLLQVAPKSWSVAEIVRGCASATIGNFAKLQDMTIVHASCLTVHI